MGQGVGVLVLGGFVYLFVLCFCWGVGFGLFNLFHSEAIFVHK